MSGILIVGNSGSGKSTLAMRLAEEQQLDHLDLDTLCWREPGIRQALDVTMDAISDWLEQHRNWVIEGCYGSIIQSLLPLCEQLIFMNPGVDACLARNRGRPWEAHKYDSMREQMKHFEQLQQWVSEYHSRDDEFSFSFHQKIFLAFQGKKTEINY